MRLARYIACLGPVSCILMVPTFSLAQSMISSPATVMWGVGGAGCAACTGGDASAALHFQNGLVAGQVNAAEQLLLLSNGMQMTIQAIGSQSIVSTTIYGDHNSANTVATQTTNNAGGVSTNGSIGLTEE